MVLPTVPNAIRALFADRASRLIAATGASVVACLGMLGAYLCVDLCDTAWQNAERNADNLLVLIEEGVRRSVLTYDRSLHDAARRAARPDVAALAPDLRRLALFDASSRATDLGVMGVTDARGRVQMCSDPDQRDLPDLGDLPDFRAHRDDPALGLMLTGPVRSGATGRPVLRMTRRIGTPDGSFAGIVAGAVFLDDFQTLFERLRFEQGSTVSLFDRDGTLLVRAPSRPQDIGRSIDGGEAYAYYGAHARGRTIARAKFGGALRLYTFANLDGLPLIVTVASDVAGIRAGWVGKAGIVAALILCLSALTFGLTVMLQREVARRARREATSRAAAAELSVLARTDGLTGLPNRRGYDEAFAAAWERAVATGSPLALLVVDADHFKQFNDRFGHRRGDEVLRALAACLSANLEGGVSCRIGGEEFAAILPGFDRPTALRAAERVRRAVVELQIAHAPEVGGVATVSVGLACAAPGPGEPPDALFLAADAALYAAKKAGRNRVRAAPAAVEPVLLALPA